MLNLNQNQYEKSVRRKMLRNQMLHKNMFNLVKIANATVVPGYIYCGLQYTPTCKINASYNLAAMNSLNKTGYFPTIPVLKGNQRAAKTSLRAIAKGLGSAFGEVYDSNLMLELLKAQNIEGVAKKIHDTKIYVNTIKSQINNGNPVIAFCEIDFDGKVPEFGSSFGGNREHAVVIVGYFEIQKMPFFIYLSWGDCYLVSALDLFGSTRSLQSPRHSESMHKFLGQFHEGHNGFPCVKNFTSQNITQSTLNSHLVFSSENIKDETNDIKFIAIKKDIFQAIDAYIKHTSEIGISFFNRHGDEGISNANELKRKINFCKTLQQIRATLNYHHDCGPGNHNPHSLKTYLKPLRMDYSLDGYKKSLKNYIEYQESLKTNTSSTRSLFWNASSTAPSYKRTAAIKILQALNGKSVNLTNDEYASLKKGKLGRIYISFEKVNKEVGIKSRISFPPQNTLIKDYYIIRNI